MTDTTVTPPASADTTPADSTPPAAATAADGTPAPSATAADGTPPAGATAADGTPPADGQPTEITYTDFAFPDGFDQAQMNVTEVSDFAKELGLNQEQAQKLVDRVIKQRTDFEGTQATTQADVVAKWGEEALADAELGGGDPAKFAANLALAVSVIDNPKLVNPEFKAFLNASGLGNHPEMIRTFARIAPSFASDSPVPGNGGAPAGDPLKGLYSSSNHN